MLCGREGNRRSGVTQAMRHRLQSFIHLRAQRLYESEMSTPPTLQRGMVDFTFFTVESNLRHRQSMGGHR